MIFQPRYDRFLSACQDISWRRDRSAKPVIDGELLSRVDSSVPNDALIGHIMAEAFLRRVDRSLVESKNIYLQKFDVSQIDLFYLMGRAYPQVPASHRIANEFLAHELRKHPTAALVEIGVGKGLQIAQLLDRLAEAPGSLRTLRIVTLDPSDENLTDSARTLRERPVPFAVTVHPMKRLVEQCTAADWDAIGELARGTDGANVVVNSAFSIHHTVHALGDVDRRTDILRTIAGLRPSLFTLVEPSANHDTEHLVKRFHACWEHFGTVFDLIEEADIDAGSKFVIKEKFFGREIRDIFGTSDAFRCERHEPFESWLLRLVKAGFTPYERVDVSPALPAYCTTAVGDGMVRLGYRGLALIAVFAYRSKGPTEADTR
jgi:GRAS domain family